MDEFNFNRKGVKKLLKKYSLFASKKLAQHFLIDKKVLEKILEAANLQKEDTVLEIGPGIGNLSRELAKRVEKVIMVEKDQRMGEILKETLREFQNIEIVQNDILKLKIFPFPGIGRSQAKQYKVVANLPYYITSPVIRKFLEAKNQPKEMVLMVQKEVAQRICALAPKMNLLAVSVQFYAEPKIISYVSKKSFWPQPKVDSAIIKLSYIRSNKRINRDLFFKIVKAGFSQPRKKILNNFSFELKLSKEEIEKWLLKNKIKPDQRAETLSLKNWQDLAKTIHN